jgi:hypothetical protein
MENYFTQAEWMTTVDIESVRGGVMYRNTETSVKYEGVESDLSVAEAVTLYLAYGDVLWTYVEPQVSDSQEAKIAFISSDALAGVIDKNAPITPFVMSALFRVFGWSTFYRDVHIWNPSISIGPLAYLVSRWQGDDDLKLTNWQLDAVTNAPAVAEEEGIDSWLLYALLFEKFEVATDRDEWVIGMHRIGVEPHILSPYLEAGINDLDLLTLAIDNGIDASLLSTTLDGYYDAPLSPPNGGIR